MEPATKEIEKEGDRTYLGVENQQELLQLQNLEPFQANISKKWKDRFGKAF